MVRVGKIACLMAGVTVLAGCTGIRDHRGYILDKELAAGVQVGVDTKDSVTKTLGRPTFTGQFDANDWYYIARDTAYFAFRRPHVTDQTVLHVRFDQAGNVTAVEQTGEELVASVKPMKGKTPTLGHEKSFFEELFGNIGTVSQGGLPTGGKTQ
jgi:outer membrane protein assembly factor BamE (lipoprotein component of BamABCDE complex)